MQLIVCKEILGLTGCFFCACCLSQCHCVLCELMASCFGGHHRKRCIVAQGWRGCVGGSGIQIIMLGIYIKYNLYCIMCYPVRNVSPSTPEGSLANSMAFLPMFRKRSSQPGVPESHPLVGHCTGHGIYDIFDYWIFCDAVISLGITKSVIWI